jgi:hypothetical protein
MRKARAAFALIVTLAACGPASGEPPDSGIAGRVTAGPTCPVERVPPAPQCAPRPLAARLRIRRAHSSRKGWVIRSGSDGRFRITLAPGRYTVTPLPEPGRAYPRPGPSKTVTVHPRHYAHVTVTYDTGIR